MVATLQESVNAQNKHTAELNSILQQLMKSQEVKAEEQNAPAKSHKCLSMKGFMKILANDPEFT